MTSANREAQVVRAFIELADRLVDDFDLLDLTIQLTEECARLLDVAAAGLLLADAGGRLHLLAATSEQAQHLEVFQLQQRQGPCVDCYRSGLPISVADLRGEAERWPDFVAAAEQEGFRSVQAIPMRLRTDVLGALGLFGTRQGTLDERDMTLAQAFAHVASIAIVQQHSHATRAGLLPALHAAVNSRSELEIAKGIVAAAHGVTMQQAFDRLRRHARAETQSLSPLAHHLVNANPSARDAVLVAIARTAAEPTRPERRGGQDLNPG